MSHTIPLEQASIKLTGLVRALNPGDEIVLTDNDKPIARIVPEWPRAKRMAGTCEGMLEILDEGDDVILEHFKEYLP